jgi:hypothetical protein
MLNRTFIRHSRQVINSYQRQKSTRVVSSGSDDIYEQALANASAFDSEHNFHHERMTVAHSVRTLVTPIRYGGDSVSGTRTVPNHIPRPPYARTGQVPHPPHYIIINGEEELDALRKSARLARDVLDLACRSAKAGMTSNDVDLIVHNAILEAGAYPSPLNYAGFPKSVCSSINEVICHGIPDDRPLKKGDLASFDVSCFYEGFHGE